ncbi:hypothetical protein [Pseudomonas fluorescens]|uniref:Uncharacterized protein n=1 Tax=Pseudomonas fluorescens TaxID=294 RepID=A0A5E7APT5_PSEFL|nr:hypothetical protein [Pseudomonas fluorescens]VVN76553.1 hypothetical protein PS833_00773 [Pseudomonas fluorescens]
MSDPLKHPKAELAAARRAIDSMKSAKTFAEFDSSWRTYLFCIEKLWKKTEAACALVRNKFEPWQAKYNRLRSDDLLLSYLQQARNADNHSIQDFTDIKPHTTQLRTIDPKPGQTHFIKSISWGPNGEMIYEGDPVLVVEIPPHPVAVPVKNRGVMYEPPSTHLDQLIDNQHPTNLAEIGWDFYRTFLESVEQKFFNTAK